MTATVANTHASQSDRQSHKHKTGMAGVVATTAIACRLTLVALLVLLARLRRATCPLPCKTTTTEGKAGLAFPPVESPRCQRTRMGVITNIFDGIFTNSFVAMPSARSLKCVCNVARGNGRCRLGLLLRYEPDLDLHHYVWAEELKELPHAEPPVARTLRLRLGATTCASASAPRWPSPLRGARRSS